VKFSAKLPLVLAYVSGNNVPASPSACQKAILTHPTLDVTLQKTQWMCTRTANGSDKAITVLIKNHGLVAELEIYGWSS